MIRIVAAAAALLLAGSALAGTDYSVTPLTKADVDLYMSIMRAAAAHNAHLSGEDKAAVDYAIALQKHPPKPIEGMPTQAQMKEMERNAELSGRATDLASYDDVIARQRGVADRYDGIKGQVESVVDVETGMVADCGRDCGGGKPTAEEVARGKKTEATMKADAPLVKPHIAEIKALRKQIGGFMFGGR